MGLVTTTPRTTRPYDTTTLDSFEPKGRRRPSVKAGRSKRRTPRDTRPKPHYVYVVLEMRPDGILGMVKGGITEVAIGHSRHGEIRRNGYDPIRVAVIEVPSKRQARAVERELLKELHALPDFGPSYGKEAVFPMWDMTFEEAQALVLAAFHLATADH